MGSALQIEQSHARLAWFLAGAYPGGAKRKRIARDFDVSPDTAKGWLNGYSWPRRETFERMRDKWGPGFIHFIYLEMSVLDACTEQAKREMRLEEARGLALVDVANAGPATGAVSESSGVGGETAAKAAAVAGRVR